MSSSGQTAQEKAWELEQSIALLARRSLRKFTEVTWELTHPGRPLHWNWHLDRLCDVLERFKRREVKRFIINIPPGTMKSMLVSVIFPAWVWSDDATKAFLGASYSKHLSLRDNVRMRNIVMSQWYQRHYNVNLTGDQNAKELFTTDVGGWRFATSVGGGGTGEHPDFVMIDDPHTAEGAQSEVERTNVCDWHDGTISTRGVIRDVGLGLIMQRLHEKDLTGYLLAKWESGTYEHIVFPMEYEQTPKHTCPCHKAKPDVRDPRRKEGELLWPEMIPQAKVKQMKVDLQELAPGQLQQHPTPKGGRLFKREWLKYVTLEQVPAGTDCRGWDIAATENGGDYTVGTKMRHTPDGKFFVMDLVRGQWSSGNVDIILLGTATMDGRSVRQREEREGGSSGKAVTSARGKALVGYDYAEVVVSNKGDKVTRSRPLRAQFEQGNVYIVVAPWNQELIAELLDFPVGANDDQVDSLATSFNDLVSGPQPVRQVEVRLG